MDRKPSGMDMLHGPLAGKLLRFTLPIALSSMVQQLFNAADTAVVGYFGNAGALAAVGTNTEIIALIVTVSSGLSAGANILIANHIGRNEQAALPAAVQTSMLLAGLTGLIGLLLGQAAAAPLLRLIRTPDGIFDAAALYLRIYLLGYPFLLLYDFGASALRARGDSRYPFLRCCFQALPMSGSICSLCSCSAWGSPGSRSRPIFPPCFRRSWCCTGWQMTACSGFPSAGPDFLCALRGIF